MARICLVGFQPSALAAIARAVGPGHSCIAYVTGKDAFRAAKSSAPDLIVSDARMFDMKAATLVQKLHASLKDRCPPVLFTAAHDEMDGDLPPSLRARFLPRPFRNAELIAAIDSLLGADEVPPGRDLLEANPRAAQCFRARSAQAFRRRLGAERHVAAGQVRLLARWAVRGP